jgi:hypothetical protein
MDEDDKIRVPPGEFWDQLHHEILLGFEEEIFELSIELQRGGIIVEGAIASESAKSAILELISRQITGQKITDRTVVTSPLTSASENSQGHFDASVEMTKAPVQLTRYPKVSSKAAPAVDDDFVFEVDLTTVPTDDSASVPIVLPIDDEDWRELEVIAEIQSDELDIDPTESRKIIRLYVDGHSRSARFVFRVLERAAGTGSVKVHVTFILAHGVRGFALREFKLAALSASEPGSASGTYLSVDAVPLGKSTAPDMTLKIRHDEASHRLIWSFHGEGIADLKESTAMPILDLKESARNYFHQKFAQAKTLQPGRHAGVLRGIGEKIWDVAPGDFKRLYLKMRERAGPNFPIQIFTDEPYVPWELMFPTDASLAEPDHLFMTHPVARWPMNTSGLTRSFERGRTISFVPEYSKGNLSGAIAEGEWLVKNFGAIAIEATYDNFLKAVRIPESEKVGLLHFAGHGAGEESANASERGLRMTDGWIPVEEINSSVKLGMRDRPMTILNACHSAGEASVLGVLHGWPSALIAQGFAGVLAPLWAVQDKHACEVVKSAISGAYRENLPMSIAILKARGSVREASPAAYAYLFYGDVLAAVNDANQTVTNTG